MRYVAIILILFVVAGMSVPASCNAQVVRSRELNTQFHRARVAWQAGTSLLEAKARIDRVIEELPADAEARRLRAEILLEMNQPEDALIDARHAARLMPTSGEVHLVHCEAALRSGNPSEATRAMRQSADQIMNDAEMYVRLSKCAQQLGYLTEAEAYARLATVQGTMSPSAHLQLARVFVDASDNKMAIAVLVRGLEDNIIRPESILRDSTLMSLARQKDLAQMMR